MDSLILSRTTREDVPSIRVIERLSFPSPWDSITIMRTISDRGSFNLTARYQGRVVGYVFSVSMRKMVHLLNLAVHPEFRRRGIGRRLLSEIISFARSTRKSYVFLEVRTSNDSARKLYASMGVSPVLTWRRYYSDTGDDAAVMVKHIERD